MSRGVAAPSVRRYLVGVAMEGTTPDRSSIADAHADPAGSSLTASLAGGEPGVPSSETPDACHSDRALRTCPYCLEGESGPNRRCGVCDLPYLTCAACEVALFADDAVCSRCGTPVQPRSQLPAVRPRPWLLAAGLFLVLLVGVFIFSGRSSPTSPEELAQRLCESILEDDLRGVQGFLLSDIALERLAKQRGFSAASAQREYDQYRQFEYRKGAYTLKDALWEAGFRTAVDLAQARFFAEDLEERFGITFAERVVLRTSRRRVPIIRGAIEVDGVWYAVELYD